MSMASGGEPKAEAIIAELWEAHSRVRPGGTLGIGVPFQSFYCETCRAPYPCSVAQTIANWGTTNPEYKYLSLRCPVKGEQITDSGTGATIGGHSWAIGSANPPTPTPAAPPPDAGELEAGAS